MEHQHNISNAVHRTYGLAMAGPVARKAKEIHKRPAATRDIETELGSVWGKGVSMVARKRLGDFLLEAGMITPEQLQEVMELQRETKERLGELLVRKGYVTEQQLIEVLEFQLGIPHINLYQFQIDPSIVRLIPEDLARRYWLLPSRRTGTS
jgi:hypothetical protein